MSDRLRHLLLNRIALRVGAVVFALIVSGGMLAHARAASALSVTQVTPCAISTTEASICWTTSSEADSSVQFGTDKNALKGKVDNTVQFEIDHKLPIGPLRAGTRYYYQVTSKDKSGASAQSSVNFFDAARLSSKTSGSAAAQLAATAPAFFDVSIAASSTTGILYFSTIPETNTTITVAAVPGSTYTGPSTYSTTVNAVDCPSGGCQYRVIFSGLSADAQFTFSITATATDGSSATYGPQQFGSGSAPDDWKVATGSCSDGTPIGSCSGAKYCDNGQLVNYCGRCGYQCPSGLTCRVGGVCTSDVTVSDANLQCNDASCYDSTGTFRSPAPIGCNSVWAKCNANVVLKVKKDRVCNQWQTCESSLETTSAQTGQKENLCLAVANCAAVDDKGNCSLFLPKGQCKNDPLKFCSQDTDCGSGGVCITDPTKTLAISYESPTQITKIAGLSGNVQAGLTFNGSKVNDSVSSLAGNFPYSNFQQVGDSFNLLNGDFEQTRRETVRNKDGSVSTVTNYSASPWAAVGAKGTDGVTQPSVAVVLENPQDKNNPNHVLEIRPTDKTNGDYSPETSGARAPADGSLNVTVQTEYHVRLRIKSGPFTKTPPTALILFNAQPRYTSLTLSQATQTRNVTLSSEWKVVDFTVPVLGQRYLEVIRLSGEAVPFYIDDVSMQPVLQIAPGTYVGRTCRLYPRSDSNTCDYTDSNGVNYTGWHGYCVQHDPKNTNICLSWWPVDLIRGDDAFKTFSSETSQAYNDRTPLYYCMESKGKLVGTSYKIDDGNTHHSGSTIYNGVECLDGAPDASPSGPWSFRVCSLSEQTDHWDVAPTDVGASLHDFDLASIELVRQNGRGEYVADAVMPTSNTFLDEDDNSANGAKGDIIYEFDQSKACDTCNMFVFRAIFSGATRKLIGFYALNDDTGGSQSEPGYFHIVYHQRDICTKLVKVVDDSGEAKPWANRVARTSNYAVPGLNYTYTSDFAPFGASVTPAGDPETWNGLQQSNAALSYPLYVELADSDNADLRTPFEVRAGSPYACVGDCGTQQCLADSKVGNQCTTDGGCSRPSDTTVSGTTNAICEGSSATNAANRGSQYFTSGTVCYNWNNGAPTLITPVIACSTDKPCPNQVTQRCLVSGDKTFAATRLQRLFTKSFGFWTLNEETGKYVVDTSGLPWNPPSTECTNGVRPKAFDSNNSSLDYCAVRPLLTNVGWVQTGQTFAAYDANSSNPKDRDPNRKNNGTVVLDTRRGGVVKVKFNVNLDPEQMPLRSVVINWKAEDPNSKEIDTVDLSSPPRSDPTNPYIFFHQYGPDSRDHTIAISVRDNWDWCNGSGSACPQPPAAKQGTGETLTVTYQ